MSRLLSPFLPVLRRPPRPLVVRGGRCARRGGSRRVVVDIDGSPIWFASDEAELAPIPEVFATALLLPHLELARPLKIVEPVCAAWRENIERAAALLGAWWGYGPCDIRCTTVPPTAASPHTALCFTGGVDSFYSLLHDAREAQTLVFARGYDVDLQDRQRADWGEQTVRAVAAETGHHAVIITTNLRQHATYPCASWERMHGGALAALGHALSPRIGRLLVSASEPIGSSLAWGSRWDLDPLFSSSRLRVEHRGAALRRTEKLWAIAHEPVVQRHLRICWQPGSAGGNCGRCEKCIRTMLTLEMIGQMDRFPALGARVELAERIERLPSVPSRTIETYELALTRDLSPSVRQAVSRLLDRTRAA